MKKLTSVNLRKNIVTKCENTLSELKLELADHEKNL